MRGSFEVIDFPIFESEFFAEYAYIPGKFGEEDGEIYTSKPCEADSLTATGGRTPIRQTVLNIFDLTVKRF